MSEPVAPRLYPRGFLVSPVPAALLDGVGTFRTVQLPGFTVQADELCELAHATSGDEWLVILGKFWPLSTGPLRSEGDVAAQELLRLAREGGTDAVERALYDAAGRYAVIARVGGRLLAWSDAGGTRSVFFNAGQQQVSSHYDILARTASSGTTGHPFGAAIGINALLDLTTHTEIKALIANHRLELGGPGSAGGSGGGRTGWRGLLGGRGTSAPAAVEDQVRFHVDRPNPMAGKSEDELYETIETLWREQLDRLVALDVPLLLSMSGGLDSRTMLAMARRHVQHFQGFTYTGESSVNGVAPTDKWEKTMAVDYDIVRSMEEFLPPLTVIARSTPPWVAQHNAVLERNATHSHGRWLLPSYLSMSPDPQTVHYRGNLLEVGRVYWETKTKEPTALAALSSMLRRYGGKTDVPEERADQVIQSRGEALGFGALHGDYRVEDVAYWELRHSRWYSQVTSETDPAFDTFTPINVRRMLDAMLAFPFEKRVSGQWQKELIHRNHPVLLFFGINDRRDLYQQLTARG